MTGYEVAERVKEFISYRMRKKLGQELFRSRTDIKAAKTKLEQDIIKLEDEIRQNELALQFLSQFKE